MLNFHRHVSPLIESSSVVHNSNTYMICEYGFSLKYAANISLHVQGAVVQYKSQIGQSTFILYTHKHQWLQF
jgi:hypothetical protein